MASGILVYVEHDGGTFKKSSLELLGKAGELVGAIGGNVSAVLVGDADGASLGAYGASTVYTAAGDGNYNTGGSAAALAAAVEASDAAVVLGAAGAVGRDLFPRVAARLGSAVASDVIELFVDGGRVAAKRPILAGKGMVTVTTKGDRALFTVRPNSFPAPAAGSGSAAVQALAGGGNDGVKVLKTRASDSTVADLTEADRIVAGGRSLGSKEKFDEVIRPLAGAIGATPGASRAAVDAGYAPHSAQVGQTGKVVNPQLYIAAGISGAIQHLAGMRTSKVIVAINKDADAPIFQHSTYGIVGDLFEVCPELQKQLAAL